MNFLRVGARIAPTRVGQSWLTRRRPVEPKHRLSLCFSHTICARTYSSHFRAPRWDLEKDNLKGLLKDSQFGQAIQEARRIINSEISIPPAILSLVIQALATDSIDSVRNALPALREKCDTNLYEIDGAMWKIADLLILARRGSGSSPELTQQIVDFINAKSVRASASGHPNTIDVLVRTCIHIYDIDTVEALIDSVFAALKHKANQLPLVNFINPGTVQMVSNKAYRLHRPDIVERVFATAESLGIPMPNAMYFHLLSAKCMKFELDQVPQLLRTLIVHQVPLEVTTITFILRACITAQKLEVAEACWKMWRDAQLHVDTQAANAFLLSVYLYGTPDHVEKVWNERSLASDAYKLDQEAYNIAVRCELRRGNDERALALLVRMQELKYTVDNISVRQILRESLFDFSNVPEAQASLMELSQALAREPVTEDSSSFELTRAIADSLPVYGSQLKLVDMQKTFDRLIPRPDMYAVARLIEGYLLADAVKAAYKCYEELLVPLLKSPTPPSSFEGARLAAIVALTVRAKATKNVEYFLATWKQIKMIPTFLPPPQVYAEFVNLGKSLLLSPQVMFSEVSRAVEVAESGAMAISSQLTRAFVSAYIKPLALEKDVNVIKKWSELPLHRKLISGKSVFSTSRGGPIIKRAKGGKEVRLDPKLEDAKIRIASKQLKDVNTAVLLSAAETKQFKEDLQRWAQELAKRTESLGIPKSTEDDSR
eukprot:TRINITY_DN13593_c0_g1_i1.p1 TRINITY_DN13593_c0_g1~~TRINITY_DN13593_c0_g1_i1.p1  ORF type:complete len:716 (+),score=96.36 TRINITY_DN13593_c0_g1_i1:130-2277(+)